MSKPYSELEKLPAEAYLNPENFYTGYDKLHSPAKHAEKLQYGYDIGRKAVHVYLNYKGVWFAQMLDGGFISSSEGIGYHALTSDLLAGFLASRCKIIVQRVNAEGNGYTETEIVSGAEQVK